MSIMGYIRITRPINSLVAGLAVLLGYLIATGTMVPEALMLIPVVAAITAAGNVINDYYDREIDRVNRPERPIPAGEIEADWAYRYSILLFIAGILFSFILQSRILIAIAVFNSFLLILYAARLKGMPLVGNMSVSYLSASIFLFGGAAAGFEGIFQTIPVACITFLAMLSREILKDMEDITGDAYGGAKTLPMLIGVENSGRIAFFFALCAVFLSYLPIMRWWGFPYVLAITVADIIILSGVLRGIRCSRAECIRESGATRLIKHGMFIAVAVFIIAAVLF